MALPYFVTLEASSDEAAPVSRRIMVQVQEQPPPPTPEPGGLSPLVMLFAAAVGAGFLLSRRQRQAPGRPAERPRAARR